MKKDKKYWALEIAQLIFFLVVPIVLFIWKCTTIKNDGGTQFIISCSGYIVAIIIFIVFKKILVPHNKKQTVEETHAPVTEKECPYCKSTININATRCPHCTSELE